MILAAKEAGLLQEAYYSFFGIGFLTAYGFLIYFGRKIRLKPVQVIIALVLGSCGVLCGMWLLQKMLEPLENVIPIMNSFLNNMGRGFVFVPLISLGVSALLRISWEKTSILYAFSQTIIWGIASLGCLFGNCCKGYPCEWGIMNAITETRLFPTQILNSVALLSVAIYIYTRTKKKKFQLDGKEYPIILILVGIIRFFTEFLMDNAKIIFGLSSLSFDSLVMCIVGTAMLVSIERKSKAL